MRPSAYVKRVIDDARIPLHKCSADTADQPADQNNQRDGGVMEAEFLVNSLDGIRRIRVDALKAFLTRPANARFQGFGIVEFRQKAVEQALGLHSTLTSGFSTICFISNIEIIGSRRTNRKNNIRKSPIVPAYVAQSHTVG